MYDDDRLSAARAAHFATFGNEGPRPYEVGEDVLVNALLAAAKSGQPIPDDFDWHPDVPKGAVV